MSLRPFIFLSIDNTIGIVMAGNRRHALKLLEKSGKSFVILWKVKEKPHVRIIGKLR